jgi:sn-glycerol 3-phosphate transport system substrate-binding protein
MKNNSIWRSLIVVLLLSIVIVGCSSNENPNEAEPTDEAAVVDEELVAEEPPDQDEIEEPVEIEFWTLLTGPLGERLDSMISEYNDSQGNVVVVNVNQGGYNEIQQKMLAALAAGDPTYVATMIDYKNVPFYANSGVLEPISDWASDEDMADFIPGLLTDLTLNDKVYALPMNRSTQGLYYNKDLFARAGLDPEKPPQTWEEVREYGMAIAALGDEYSGTYGTGNMQWYFEPLVYEFGGEFSDAECNFTFNDEFGVAAATYLQDLIHKDGAAIIPANLSGPFDQQMSEFVQGNIGMIRQSTAVNGFISDVVDFDWGFTMFPEGPAGRAVTGGGANVAIGAHATDEEKAAAWDFIRWLTNAENSAAFHMATGYMPSRYSVAELPEVQAFYEDHPTWQISVDQLDFSRPTSCAVLNSPQWAAVIESNMDRILINNEDVQTVLDEAVAELNEALEAVRADGTLIQK